MFRCYNSSSPTKSNIYKFLLGAKETMRKGQHVDTSKLKEVPLEISYLITYDQLTRAVSRFLHQKKKTFNYFIDSVKFYIKERM